MAGSCRSPTLARRSGGGRAGARGCAPRQPGRARLVRGIGPGRLRRCRRGCCPGRWPGADVDDPADPIWLAIDNTLHHRATATVAYQYDVPLERGDKLGHGGDVVVEGCTGGRSFSQTRKSDGMGGEASSAQAGLDGFPGPSSQPVTGYEHDVHSAGAAAGTLGGRCRCSCPSPSLRACHRIATIFVTTRTDRLRAIRTRATRLGSERGTAS